MSIEHKALRIWFIHGEHPGGPVDICDSEGDIMTVASRDHAERIIKARDTFLDAVGLILGPRS